MNLSINCTNLAGHVAHLCPNWEVLTQDQWVLQTVGGYQYVTPAKFTMSGPITTSNKNHTREHKTGNIRGSRAIIERGNSGDTIETGQLCVSAFPSREEGWQTEASNKPERSQPVSEGRTLQDGGPSPTPRPPTVRGLDGEDGPERCISSGPHPSNPPTPPHIPMGEEILHVHVPTLRSLCCTESCTNSIHETTKTSSRLPTSDRMSLNNIFGRPSALAPG